MSILIKEAELPVELTNENVVEAAYACELAEVASKLQRGLPTLIECDKDLSPFLYVNLRNRLRAVNLRCLYLDGRPRQEDQNQGGPIPVGMIVGHTGRGTLVVVSLVNALRALPTLGVLLLAVLLWGLGLVPPIVALMLLGIPPLLAGTYAGIAAVDRNILRLAIYEMLHRDDIPPIVSINEAVDIAKKFSTEDSGKFVNGILDKVKGELMRPARAVK